jgi:hypothetical protein
MSSAGVPQQVVAGFQQAGSSGFDVNKLTGVGAGFDLGKTILAQIPAAAQAFIEPFINAIVQGIYAAFSLAVAQTFYIAVVAAGIAAVAAAAMIEHPLRTAVNPAPGAGASSQSATPPLPVSTFE